jgi:hypothetical protein
MEHLFINIIILWVAIGLWLGNRKLKKEIEKEKPTYEHYLYKLHLILDVSEYEIFKIAAKEKGIPEYMTEDSFRKYIKMNHELPLFLKEFLDEGKEYIENYKLPLF